MQIISSINLGAMTRTKAQLAALFVSLAVAPVVHAGPGAAMFCEVVRKEVSLAVKAAQSGTSRQVALAQVQAKTNAGTNPKWTRKRIRLVEGVYSSENKLDPKEEADFEWGMCVALGPEEYMTTAVRYSNASATSIAESDKRIKNLEQEIAEIDRKLGANKAAMDQNNANYQRRLQANAAADAAEAEVKRKISATNERKARAGTRSLDCLVMPIGSTMVHVDCN